MQQGSKQYDDDKLLTAKGTVVKKDSKNRDVLSLSLSLEQVSELLTELQAAAEKSEGRGCKITIHTGEKEGPRGPFLSSFFFVKSIQEFGAAFKNAQATPTKFVPKPKADKTLG